MPQAWPNAVPSKRKRPTGEEERSVQSWQKALFRRAKAIGFSFGFEYEVHIAEISHDGQGRGNSDKLERQAHLSETGTIESETYECEIFEDGVECSVDQGDRDCRKRDS